MKKMTAFNEWKIVLISEFKTHMKYNENISFITGVRCGYPERLLNGIITGRRYDYESTIRYSCDNNYRLRGPERRYCNENGTWEGSTPTCEGERNTPLCLLQCMSRTANHRGLILIRLR